MVHCFIMLIPWLQDVNWTYTFQAFNLRPVFEGWFGLFSRNGTSNFDATNESISEFFLLKVTGLDFYLL